MEGYGISIEVHSCPMVPYGNPYYRSMETLGEMYGFSIGVGESFKLNYKSSQSGAMNFPAKILWLAGKFVASDWLLLKNVDFLYEIML